MASYQKCDGAQLALIQSMILLQLDGRLKPELRLSIGANNMDVQAWLLS